MKTISQSKALAIIVIAQFLGTSLWFAGNAVIPQLADLLKLEGITSQITSAVQFGFIVGTLVFAVFSIPDRFSPSKVFLVSSIIASLFNLLIVFFTPNLGGLLLCRFMVGFLLAGIYPVGMKIASDYYEKGLGVALGLLVGALVLGTAFPHLIASLELSFSWALIFWITSGLAILGGLLVGYAVPDGPHRKALSKFDVNLIPKLFKSPKFKAAALGYFGHMWELYTFWAFCPLLIAYFNNSDQKSSFVSFLAFTIIGVGGVSCAVGGFLSKRYSSSKVALFALSGSGLCCLLLAFIPSIPTLVWIVFLLVWGVLVTADSPQFSTLVAGSVSGEFKGTALTIVNCLGFGLTIVSLSVTDFFIAEFGVRQALNLLAIGPILGVLFYRLIIKKGSQASLKTKS